MNNDWLSGFVGLGLLGLIVFIAIVVVGFVLSAFVTSLYLRLVIRFSRRTLDNEYQRMRAGGEIPLRVPRDWV